MLKRFASANVLAFDAEFDNHAPQSFAPAAPRLRDMPRTSLFGLDLDQAQVDRGRAFVAGVVERAGEEGLGRLWSPARNLPTPAEVDAPGLWLERIALPELDAPAGD